MKQQQINQSDQIKSDQINMDVAVNSVFFLIAAIITAVGAWKVLKWAWLTPKKLEKKLKAQGLHGNPYKFLFGDFKELTKMSKEATSKPMNLYDDDLPPRIIPAFDKIVKRLGICIYIYMYILFLFLGLVWWWADRYIYI